MYDGSTPSVAQHCLTTYKQTQKLSKIVISNNNKVATIQIYIKQFKIILLLKVVNISKM